MFDGFRGSGPTRGRLFNQASGTLLVLVRIQWHLRRIIRRDPYSDLNGGATPSQEPRRQHKDRTNECEECFERDADQPERQRQKPDHRKEDQREQSQGPAKHEQDAPSDKEDQSFHIVIISSCGAPSTLRGDHNHSGFANLAIPVATTALQVGWRLQRLGRIRRRELIGRAAGFPAAEETHHRRSR